MSRSFALIVSAGSGQRFGQIPPKQFSKVDGRTVLEISIQNILSSYSFESVFVAVPSSYMELAKEELRELRETKISLVEGGATRRESILNLMDSLQRADSPRDEDIITVFDANRPLTTAAVTVANIENARVHGVSCPTLPLVNGVAQVSGGQKIVEIPRREDFVQIVTPESASWGLIRNYLELWKSTEKISGIAELFVYCNKPVATVHSDKFSLKITHPEDWGLFQLLLEEKNKMTYD